MFFYAANEKDIFLKLIEAIPRILNWLTCFKVKEVLREWKPFLYTTYDLDLHDFASFFFLAWRFCWFVI